MSHAAVKRSSVANARVQGITETHLRLMDQALDRTLYARPREVQELVREARSEAQADATPAWVYAARESA